MAYAWPQDGFCQESPLRLAFGRVMTEIALNQSMSSCTYSPDRNPDELVWKHLRADTVGRMTITDKADFKAKVRASMCQLQNDPEKICTKNYRSNMPPDGAFTYGLINSAQHLFRLTPIRHVVHCVNSEL